MLFSETEKGILCVIIIGLLWINLVNTYLIFEVQLSIRPAVIQFDIPI